MPFTGANLRVDPFTDADQSIYIAKEGQTVPASNPYFVWLKEIPRLDSPSSIIVRGSGTTDEVNSNRDSLLDQSFPNTNYSTATYSQTGREGAGSFPRKRFILGFDLTGMPESADSAKVHLFLENTSGTGAYPNEEQHGIHEVTQSWIEAIVTWGNQPTYDPVALDVVSTFATGTYIWDITTLYNQWKSGAKTNHGVVLINADDSRTGNQRQFSTKEHATSGQRPKLVVVGAGTVYTEVARTTNPGPLQVGCNYNRGALRFNEANASASLEIDYYGRGAPIRAEDHSV